jgi:hypothetical protein
MPAVAAFLHSASRPALLGALAAEGLVLGAAYVGVLLLAGWLDGVDRDVLRRLWPGADRGTAP